MKEGTAITLIQNPIIKHNLEAMGKSVSERIQLLNLDNQVATEDTIKTLKETRAELNKEAKEFEAQRKAIKDAVFNPYNDFEAIYKEQIINKYKDADEKLKEKINAFEMAVKTEKRDNIIAYFNELCQVEKIDFLKFENLGFEINLSTTEKKYKEQVLDFITKVTDDLSLIKTEQFSAEILVEYKKSLKASQAIQDVRNRKEAERLEAERIKAERTDSRRKSLLNLAFVYHDLTRTYNWVRDENIMISLSDIETLPNEEWTKKYAELELSIKKDEPKEESRPLEAPVVEVPMPDPAPTPAKTETVKEEIFTAKFQVEGTYRELKALSEFLKSHGYNYKNIE